MTSKTLIHPQSRNLRSPRSIFNLLQIPQLKILSNECIMTIRTLIRFTSDAGALERILRLLQSLSQILAAYSLSAKDVKVWMHLRKQFALGRRYFRFFRFLDCFAKSLASFHENEGLDALLGTGKWSCMGIYLGLESVTILDAIGVWPTPWADVCMLEANKFWFYSLVFSITWGCIQFFWGHSGLKVEVGKEHNGRNTDPELQSAKEVGKRHLEAVETRQRLKRKLATDFFDLFIPGNVTGWIPASLAVVGFASVISTILSSKEIWDRLQKETR